MSACATCGVSGQPDGARFCFSCGAALTLPTCPACSAESVPGARFCSRCGALQAGEPAIAGPGATGPVGRPVAARRVTSVLFGDLVGFTSLSEGRDQEEVRELLSRYFDECRQVIDRYGGTVEKFIGDAVMAVWGVPTAYEDDAERAVRAGLELVGRVEALGVDVDVPGLAMRVGIVTGEVAVTIGALQQGMVAGDAVNTAARVQSTAAPGQVWVDETTRLLTSAAISYDDVGSHAMKGKADPVQLWSVRAVVAGIGGGQRTDGLEAPHVGRDRDLRLVKELFHGVEETSRPALLLVSGEPGVGKTRLGWEFAKYTDGLSTGVFWHRGRCLSYGEGVAYYALAEAIRGRLLALRPDGGGAMESDEDQARLLAQGLDVLVADPDERAWLEPRVAALLGIGTIGTFKREDLFNAWSRIFERIGQGTDPVVLVIDDAQHADDGLIGFLEHLVTVSTFPIFVMLLARPELLDERGSLLSNRRVTVLHLEPLSVDQMGQLLDGLVSGLPALARASLVRRAEGIPLFAVETVRSLIDRDLVLPRGGQYVLADPQGLDLDSVAAPATLHALVSARLDALPAEQRRVVDVASVIGMSFTRDKLEGLCPDVVDLDAALGALVRLQVLRQELDRLSAEHGQFQFVQSVVRQVAHGTLSRRDRKALHLAVAERLGEDDNSAGELSPIIAQHLLEALDALPEAEDRERLRDAAIDHLRRGAARASALGAPTEAAGHLDEALVRCADAEVAAQVQCGLAEVLLYTGDYARSAELAQQAQEHYEAVGDTVGAGRAVGMLARALIWGPGELERAAQLAEQWLAAVAGLPGAAEVELSLSSVRVAALLRAAADIQEAAEHHARLADRVGNDFDVADSYISLALHYLTAGPRGLARVLLQAAAEMARRLHDQRLLARAMTNLNADYTQDDARRAVDFGREAVSAARLISDQRWVSVSRLNLALAAFVAGDWAFLDQDAEEPYENMDGVFVNLVRASVAHARGAEPAAVVESDATAEDLALLAFRRATQGLLRVRAGEPAGELLVESAELYFRQGGISDDFALLWQILTELAWESGDRDTLDRLAEVLGRDRLNRPSTGLRAQQARVCALLAVVDGGEPSTVEAHFRRALTEAAAWKSAPTLARCQADFGAWLTGRGRADEAAPLLEAARVEFARLGASHWLEQLERSLSPIAG